jgi:predicted metal-dependent hydrolase
VVLPSPGRGDLVAAVVRDWYSARAQTVFTWRLREWLRQLADWQLPEPTLRRRRMRRRWGSCTSTRVVTLNTHLVERPLSLIDFVIAHELCHLVELNHSPRFYRLMDRAMPDWRQRASALDASRPAV